ncbi:hypothetical protein LTR85_005195 [Meristemomyces frigidus]|nr:hypothetical protein LTR85_005195 [Meristemomyces frigidus]
MNRMRSATPRFGCTQRRTFLGLRRPPPPKTPMMGYLVAQGLAIVLLADLAFATLQNEPTTVRAVCQSAGFWQEQEFEKLHGKDDLVTSTVQ